MSIFLTDDDKQTTVVGFSKKAIFSHRGIAGLKYYLIVMYFRKHVDTFGEVTFTLNKLLRDTGYSIKSHNESAYNDFRRIIQEEIIDKGFATSDDDILKVKPTSLYVIKLLPEKNLFFAVGAFVQISVAEYETIVNSDSGKVNKSVLLGTYIFIKQFIMSDSFETETVLKISYPSKEQIRHEIDVSIATIENAIAILLDLKLLYVRRNMYIENSVCAGTFIPTRNVYALSPDVLADDSVLTELAQMYGKPVYDINDVPGSISYISKKKRE